MIREALAAVARNEALGPVISRTPVARDVVKRLVAGETPADAVSVVSELTALGFLTSLERAAPTVSSAAEADAVAQEYVELVRAIAEAGLATVCEVTVLPEALGLLLEPGAARRRFDSVVEVAQGSGVPVMLGTGPGADTDTALAWAADLVASGRSVGVTIPAMLRRAEAECRTWSGRRVRLVKGERRADPQAAFTQPIEIDKSFVRCAKALLQGDGEPSFATHDGRLVDIVTSLSDRYGRRPRTFEYTFFMGRQQGIQDRLLGRGEAVRVYVPYGPQWFERLVGGLAEQSSSIAGAVWSLRR